MTALKKRGVLFSILAVFSLSFWAVVLLNCSRSNVAVIAQSNNTANSTCSNNIVENKIPASTNQSEAKTGCDFSRYKTLKVLSLKINRLPQPKYPQEATDKRLKGCVPVKILVDAKGSVIKYCAFTNEKFKNCSDPIKDTLFEKLSEEAAAKAKFDVRRLTLGDRDFFEMILVYRFAPAK